MSEISSCDGSESHKRELQTLRAFTNTRSTRLDLRSSAQGSSCNKKYQQSLLINFRTKLFSLQTKAKLESFLFLVAFGRSLARRNSIF